jgi:mevalonate pyrophosphate decarboxylase
VTVDLILQVTRTADNRLSGTVRTISGSEARSFSGTLELMWVFEELVPATDEALPSAEPGANPDTPEPIDQ